MKKCRTNSNIAFANACYTGGGIYVYYGKLTDGQGYAFDNFADTEEIDLVSELSDMDNMLDSDWTDEHRTGIVMGAACQRLIVDTLTWIINNKPDGNYAESEIEDDLHEFKVHFKAKANPERLWK